MAAGWLPWPPKLTGNRNNPATAVVGGSGVSNNYPCSSQRQVVWINGLATFEQARGGHAGARPAEPGEGAIDIADSAVDNPLDREAEGKIHRVDPKSLPKIRQLTQ